MSTNTTVVVGAGSAGGIIAARLSEDPDHRVILVEAGPDYPTAEELPEPLKDAYNPQLTGHDWEMTAYFTEPPEERGETAYPRGRVVGGSSAVNGTVGIRGTVADFDRWAQLGNPSWAWEKVLPSFIGLEDDHDFGSAEHHGTGGPVDIFRFPESGWPLSMRKLKADLLARGVPECPDVNEPGATGVGTLPRNQTGELRGSTLITHLADARKRDNLEIRSLTEVVRVLVEDGRAVGIEVQAVGGTQRETIRADRVVLSAGAINSPKILQLSGIGPAGELARLGIPVVRDVPGVGRNLHDHPGIALVVTTREADPEHHGFRVYARLPSAAGGENSIMYVPGQMAVNAVNFEVDTEAEDIVFLASVNAKPKSRGWLSLRSTDHREQPDIHVNFLAEDVDLEVLKEGYRILVESATKGALSEIVDEVAFPSPAETGGDLLSWLDTPAADEWIRKTGLIVAYHPVGTCRMGPADDPGTVVDERLRVHGVPGLYVADASVMPEITNGMTNLSVYLIGHHFVSLFREAA
ncbi:GMC family oxidoreductase [Amycolatopsis sp. Poz14]|uniref:GMC family oxidoreductase n=1 Tax=Amycolatopsis sp. Poz14 TaxID=1447705 RepID=UPI001EE94F09|nr:GMC family oxidoreductase N-terminal domain-containing protein [Amycolatopsis sp. Poz14]MCG3754005.1 GMC family oxidoreductase N-terminal domain-containing protein [Amycolatopsis sp. Poz14]